MSNKYSRDQVMLITTMADKVKAREPVIGRERAKDLLNTIVRQMDLDDECREKLYKRLGWT